MAGPEELAQLRGVGCRRQLGRDAGDAAAIHLIRAEKREGGLLLQRVCAAIPEKAALWHDIRG
jgi:hypothetical protein